MIYWPQELNNQLQSEVNNLTMEEHHLKEENADLRKENRRLKERVESLDTENNSLRATSAYIWVIRIFTWDRRDGLIVSLR